MTSEASLNTRLAMKVKEGLRGRHFLMLIGMMAQNVAALLKYRPRFRFFAKEARATANCLGPPVVAFDLTVS
jgi:hypothetical protein